MRCIASICPRRIARTRRPPLWKDENKSDEVISGDAFDLSTDHTLYVEGIAASASPRDVGITATYTPGALGADFTVLGTDASDVVNLTVGWAT